jgi:hypothetical protein
MNVQSLIEQARAQDPGHTSSTIPLSGNDNQMTSILGALTSVTQGFTGLQDTVNQLLKISGHTEKVYDVNRDNSIYISGMPLINRALMITYFNMCKQRKEITNQIKEFVQIPLYMWTLYRQIYKKRYFRG